MIFTAKWPLDEKVYASTITNYKSKFFSLLQNSDILNLGTGSVSWFEANGPGCKPIFSTNGTLEDPFRPIRPDRVEGCLLDYWIIEIVHSAVQIFLTVSSSSYSRLALLY
jgi:hypothetical protein